MPAAKKVALVADIKQDLERAEVAIGSDHSGLDVQAFQALRRALSPANVRVRVVKNSLTKLAAEEAGRPEMADLLQGPTTLTLGYGDPVAPARLLMEYLRAERVDLPIYGAWLEGRVLSAAEVEELAKTPSREELIAQIAGKLRSPVQNLAGLLQATLRDFNGLVEARANQLEEGEAA
ncbi:MAG: 50S ribosomal protein L10 [Chloroflexota bacterium]|nr:50S ribosomal protein L10 [Chloroflexota bacterium]